ncbi:MAG: bacteriohemerythrin [Spirochaetaceae bacterium]|nr:bacteriohemerythrin [Spirochaetaceae bacterium]
MEPFVAWESRYAIGIPLIDKEHKELLTLTNELYEACREGDEAARGLFKDVVRRTVQYVKYHFSHEEQILESITYPELAPHKREHENFVKKVLEEVKNFEDGKTFVPNTFVRYLRDWILSHIAVSDKKYAEYIFQRKKEGSLKVEI